MKTKNTRILKALIAISLLALLTLLASCANEAVSLDASPQGIEVQADEAADKTFIKDGHDKEHGKGHDKGNRGKQGQVFEIVATNSNGLPLWCCLPSLPLV